MSYKRRNLPCCFGGKDLPYCITGKELSANGRVIGAGVIEWCFDRLDAETLLVKMKQDPCFQGLKIGDAKY